MNYLFNINKQLLLIIFFYLICSVNCNSQEVIATSSGYSETSSLSISWTIGENFTETFSNGEIMLTQGFNQGNIIITDISKVLLPEFTITAYPNPANEFINIKIESKNTEYFTAEIYNLSGTRLISELMNSDNTCIDIQSLPESNYILRISDSHQRIKSFKIIKTD